MNALSFLERLSRLEQSAADLYKWYAEIFDEIEPARELFLTLHNQEIQHKNLIALQSRLVVSGGLDLPDIDIDAQELAGLERSIDEHMREGVFVLADALQFAIDVESNVVESHYKLKIMEAVPSMAGLMKALVAGDKEHKEALGKLQKIAPEFSY